MSVLSVGLIVFACVFSAAVAGIMFSAVLPKSHLSVESKDVVKVAIGLVATMTALLLGLLVASAKGSFDSQQNRVIQIAAKAAFLDRVLTKSGPGSDDARVQLRGEIEQMIDRIWPAESTRSAQLAPFAAGGDKMFAAINNISAQNEEQKAAKAMALKTALDIGELNSELFAKAGTAIPKPLLIVVVTWLVIIFFSFGLFAPPNGTVITALMAAALSVSTALHMILELDRAFGGLIGVSGEPMRNVVSHFVN